MNYALNGDCYPIETKEQVKTATQFFTSNLVRFSPFERAEIAYNLEKRAEELNIDLDLPWVTNYSRLMKKEANYSPDFSKNMAMRWDMCNNYKVEAKIGDSLVKAAELIDKLVAEQKTTNPVRMVAAIAEFDKQANLEGHYDNRIMDPVFTVFGSLNSPNYDFIKIAECAGKPVGIKHLKKSAKNKRFMSKMSSLMGKDFADGYSKDPETIFSSIPNPEQQLIMEKMAETEVECGKCKIEDCEKCSMK
jgi:hypothetical protein